MFEVFLLYDVNPTTWFYLSLLMITGIFFKFRRVWSVRNLDLFLLLLLGPGLLLIARDFYFGYVMVLTSIMLLMMRMICDPMMVRRPLLEVNLSRGGLIFTCVALMVFQIASVVLIQTSDCNESQISAPLEQLITYHLNDRLVTLDLEREMNQDLPTDEKTQTENKAQLVHGPGLPFFTKLCDFPRQWRYDLLKKKRLEEMANSAESEVVPPQTYQLDQFPIFPIAQIRLTIFLSILAQLAIVLGIVLVSWKHFENFNTGIAAATLYMLLPYVAQIPSRLDHLIPAALLVWAVFSWRLPSLAGILLGTAAALSYYPFFLIPLWCAFYWSKGFWRFFITSLGTFLLLIAISIPLSGGWGAFVAQSGDIFGCVGLFSRNAAGFWDISEHSVFYRLPVIAIYLVLVFILTFWPSQKNFGTLMSSSAALMAGAQFCHPFQGGTYMAWFLPLMILVIFRPNLENRTAARGIGRHLYRI